MLSRDDEESRVTLAGGCCDVDVLLRDGETAHIRSVRESDAAALRTMYDGVSEDTLYLRFFTLENWHPLA
jgi:hypothetical protein